MGAEQGDLLDSRAVRNTLSLTDKTIQLAKINNNSVVLRQVRSGKTESTCSLAARSPGQVQVNPSAGAFGRAGAPRERAIPRGPTVESVLDFVPPLSKYH